jgi:hypothetical protein
VKSANDALWPLLDRSHELQYVIAEPYLAFSELRGLIASLSRRSPPQRALSSSGCSSRSRRAAGLVCQYRAGSRDLRMGCSTSVQAAWRLHSFLLPTPEPKRRRCRDQTPA